MKGHIRRQSKGSWSVVLSWREGGRFKQKWFTVNGPKSDAQAVLAKKLTEFNAGARAVEPARLTLADFLHRWLDEVVKPNVRPTTYLSYELMVRRHILPEIGAIRITKLTPARLQKFCADKLAGPRADGCEGHLSPRTVRYIHGVLRTALGQAVKWNIIGRNPTDAVVLPRREKKEMRPFSVKEAKALLKAVREDDHYALYYLAVSTGMRRGELLGLRWADVDFDAGTLRVSQSLVCLNGRISFQQPKTERSRRELELPAETVELLRRHRFKQIQDKLFFGPDYQDGGLVFAQPDGRPTHPRNLVRHFKTAVRKAGLPPIRFHDLRHTFASIAIPAVGLKVASDILGHEDISTTANIYGHVLRGVNRQAIGDVSKQVTPD